MHAFSILSSQADASHVLARYLLRSKIGVM